jgi:DNA-binding NarL/FixJ family response regulator
MRLGIEVVGEAGNYKDLMKLLETTTPDLILLDRELPGMNLKKLIATIRELDSSPSVIVMNERTEMEREALTAGADAFVHKGNHPKQLLIAIENVRIERGHHQNK